MLPTNPPTCPTPKCVATWLFASRPSSPLLTSTTCVSACVRWCACVLLSLHIHPPIHPSADAHAVSRDKWLRLILRVIKHYQANELHQTILEKEDYDSTLLPLLSTLYSLSLYTL